ncbi:MAG: bifunctional adenosylcobinamide kinase/adenosylcobinamide-phosphate guanylyltransferase [Clostridium sp.]
MMHLVTGASASGKSAYAEDLLVPAKSAEKYYIATMRPWGARKERHGLKSTVPCGRERVFRPSKPSTPWMLYACRKGKPDAGVHVQPVSQ